MALCEEGEEDDDEEDNGKRKKAQEPSLNPQTMNCFEGCTSMAVTTDSRGGMKLSQSWHSLFAVIDQSLMDLSAAAVTNDEASPEITQTAEIFDL